MTYADIQKVVELFYKMEGDRNLRLGQFLCNHFNVTDNEIFYEEKDGIAYGKFLGKYGECKCPTTVNGD